MINDELIPLSDISNVKDKLLSKYIQLLNPPKGSYNDCRKDINRYCLMDIAFMPYWMVMELDNLGYDVNDSKTLLF